MCLFYQLTLYSFTASNEMPSAINGCILIAFLKSGSVQLLTLRKVVAKNIPTKRKEVTEYVICLSNSNHISFFICRWIHGIFYFPSLSSRVGLNYFFWLTMRIWWCLICILKISSWSCSFQLSNLLLINYSFTISFLRVRKVGHKKLIPSWHIGLFKSFSLMTIQSSNFMTAVILKEPAQSDSNPFQKKSNNEGLLIFGESPTMYEKIKFW